MTEKFPFLSPEWEAVAEGFGSEVHPEAPEGIEFSLNVTVSPTPYGDKLLSIRAENGSVHIEKEHVGSPDVSVKTDYDTAYDLFLGADMNVILSAMLEGKIVVNGDIAKLLALAPAPGAMPSMPFSEEMGEQLRNITLEKQ
jgi:hypothetical protein